MSMAAIKRHLVSWCAERAWPAPSFERISTDRGEALPVERHDMVADLAGHRLRIPVLLLEAEDLGAGKRDLRAAQRNEDKRQKLIAELAVMLDEIEKKGPKTMPTKPRSVTLEGES